MTDLPDHSELLSKYGISMPSPPVTANPAPETPPPSNPALGELGRAGAAATAAEAAEPEGTPAGPSCFAELTEGKTLMLDLVYADGSREALPYMQMVRIRFREDILVDMPAVTITITGRRLQPVYKALMDHRALRIQEAIGVIEPDGTQPFVSKISVEER